MERRRLGSSDLEVGAVAFGCWRFAGATPADATERIEAALAAGMDLVDTADIYGHGGDGFGAAETLLGKVLAGASDRRDRMVLATKGGIVPGVPYDSSDLVRACEASLRRLGVDVIDLYQVHRPDLLAHPAEVAEALDRLVDDGKVRAVGVSNFTPAQTAALAGHLRRPLATTQPELSVAHLDPIDDGTLDQAMAMNLTPLAWSPLGGGSLVTGGEGPVATALDELAAAHATDRAGIALAFVLRHPSGAIPIVGTQRPERIAAAAAATDVHLDRAEWYRLVAATGRELP